MKRSESNTASSKKADFSSYLFVKRDEGDKRNGNLNLGFKVRSSTRERLDRTTVGMLLKGFQEHFK